MHDLIEEYCQQISLLEQRLAQLRASQRKGMEKDTPICSIA